jgi:hypothetical protein
MIGVLSNTSSIYILTYAASGDRSTLNRTLVSIKLNGHVRPYAESLNQTYLCAHRWPPAESRSPRSSRAVSPKMTNRIPTQVPFNGFGSARRLREPKPPYADPKPGLPGQAGREQHQDSDYKKDANTSRPTV